MSGPSVVIKKYENRRLYDTSNSRYVNLEDIAQMVREGTEIRVIDAATGEDLTRLVLTQIIVESAKIPDSPFPLDMLRQMIMASGQVSQEGMRTYMKSMSDLYQNAYRAFVPPLSAFATAEQAKSEPSAGNSNAGSVAEEGTSVLTDSQHAPIDDLRRRIEALERLVAKNAGVRPAAKRKQRSRAKR
jgi:polyhydroxyalkanoate synthesis repressor PhaR